jgi:hypothetical protein
MQTSCSEEVNSASRVPQTMEVVASTARDVIPRGGKSEVLNDSTIDATAATATPDENCGKFSNKKRISETKKASKSRRKSRNAEPKHSQPQNKQHHGRSRTKGKSSNETLREGEGQKEMEMAHHKKQAASKEEGQKTKLSGTSGLCVKGTRVKRDQPVHVQHYPADYPAEMGEVGRQISVEALIPSLVLPLCVHPENLSPVELRREKRRVKALLKRFDDQFMARHGRWVTKFHTLCFLCCY